MEIIKGYKAFKKGLTCLGFQYQENAEYKIDGKLQMCNNGFHFCENPLERLK